MRRRWAQIGLALLLALALFATLGFAQGRGRGQARGKSRATVVITDDRFDRFERFDRRDRDRVVIARDRVIFPGTFNGAGRPPGWDRGRKVGWGNCDVPPGLAKKYGCRSTFFRDDRRPRQRSVIIFPWFFR